MSEYLKALAHRVRHFWMLGNTYDINGQWAGYVCDCGAHFGTGLQWHQFLKSLKSGLEETE